MADKTKEGAHFVAERTKPATDKIKDGVVTGYNKVKTKITGEKPPEETSEVKKEENEGADTNEQLDQNQNMENMDM